jgi:hypothetical protein
MTQEHVASGEELSPSSPMVRQATMAALEPRVPQDDLREFLGNMDRAGAPAPIGATVTLKIAVWGKLLVEPDKQPWKYDNTVWGGPAYFGSSVGFMYTAYDSWDAFFRNVTSCHVQGVDAGGGVLQVNWFIGNGTPVGQFNGVAGGAGAVEGGGAGKWSHT